MSENVIVLERTPNSKSRNNFQNFVRSFDNIKQCPSQYLVGPLNRPIPKLLFRYFDHESSGQNSSSSFSAAKIMRSVPQYQEFLELAATHLNEGRGRDKNKTPSPFISTTSSLIWAMQMGLKKNSCGQIAVFDTSRIDTPIYAARRICEDLRERKLVTFRYRASVEFFAWQSIQPTFTFKLQDLEALFESSSRVKNFIRPSLLRDPGLLIPKIGRLSSRKLNYHFRFTIAALLHRVGAAAHGNEVCTELVRVFMKDWRVSRAGYRPCDLLQFRTDVFDLISDGFCTAPPTSGDQFSGVVVSDSRASWHLLKNSGDIESETGLLTPPLTPQKHHADGNPSSLEKQTQGTLMDTEAGYLSVSDDWDLPGEDDWELIDDDDNIKPVYVRRPIEPTPRVPQFLFCPYDE